jgi:hypothetical protein
MIYNKKVCIHVLLANYIGWATLVLNFVNYRENIDGKVIVKNHKIIL